MKMSILLSSVLALGLSGGPALAEVVTLRCTYLSPQLAATGGAPTVDVDFDGGVVRFPTVTYRIDQVTDRYIFYGAGLDARINGSAFRLDRKTGVMDSRNVSTNQFMPQLQCQRVTGSVL